MIAHNDTKTCIQSNCRGSKKSSLCVLQSQRNAVKFASYLDQVVERDFKDYRNYACLELCCFQPSNSNAKKFELQYMENLIKEFGLMYIFDVKSKHKIKMSALHPDLQEELKKRPVVHLNKKVFEEVVEETITPQLNELSKSVATVGENVIGTMEAISGLEDTVKGSEIHLGGKINVIDKKLDKLLSFNVKFDQFMTAASLALGLNNPPTGKTTVSDVSPPPMPPMPQQLLQLPQLPLPITVPQTVVLSVKKPVVRATKIKTVTPTVPQPDSNLVCCLCNVAYLSEHDLEVHIDTKHQDLFNNLKDFHLNPLASASANTSNTAVTRSRKRTRAECSNVLPSAKKPNFGQRINCTYCAFDFASKKLLRTHSLKEHKVDIKEH